MTTASKNQQNQFYTKSKLTRMKKCLLYELASKIQEVEYRRSTKADFIEIIMNHQSKDNEVPKVPKITTNTLDYNEDYIQNLVDQVEYWKNQCQKEREEAKREREEANNWRDKYIALLISKPIQDQPRPIAQPIQEKSRTISKPIQEQPKPITQPNKLKVDQNTKIIKTKPEPIKPETPWGMLPRINKKTSNLPFGEIIKRNSTIQRANEMPREEIEELGYKTRREYVDSQISEMGKKKCLIDAADNQKNLLKKVEKKDKKQEPKKLSLMDQIKLGKKKKKDKKK